MSLELSWTFGFSPGSGSQRSVPFDPSFCAHLLDWRRLKAKNARPESYLRLDARLPIGATLRSGVWACEKRERSRPELCDLVARPSRGFDRFSSQVRASDAERNQHLRSKWVEKALRSVQAQHLRGYIRIGLRRYPLEKLRLSAIHNKTGLPSQKRRPKSRMRRRSKFKSRRR